MSSVTFYIKVRMHKVLVRTLTFACTNSHWYSNTCTQNPSHQWCNVNCKYRQHTSSCRSTPAQALSSSLTTSTWPPALAHIRAVLPSNCTREVEREIATDCPEIYNLCFMSQPQALLHSTSVAICHSLIPRPRPRGEGLVTFSQFLGLEPLH